MSGNATPPATVTMKLRRLNVVMGVLPFGARDLGRDCATGLVRAQEPPRSFDGEYCPFLSGVIRLLGGGPFQADRYADWECVEQRIDARVAVAGSHATAAFTFAIVDLGVRQQRWVILAQALGRIARPHERGRVNAHHGVLAIGL